MAKGVVPFSHPLWLGAVGLQARDYVSCGFDRADVVISVGYDMVEYHPNRWNPNRTKRIVHIDSAPAEVDEYYVPDVEVVGRIGESLEAIGAHAQPEPYFPAEPVAGDHGRAFGPCRRRQLPDEASADRVGLAAGAGVALDRGLRRGGPQGVDGPDVSAGAAQYVHHLQRLRGDGHCGAGGHRGQARVSRPARGRRDRRCRLHGQLAGDRDRSCGSARRS